MQNEYAAKAFVSCSLRPEDEKFVNFICKILRAYNIEPFGTVGKFSASPENPIALMNKNIPLSDFVVIVATPRYLQKDLSTGKFSYGLSEMVHIETGMAIAHGKPVIAFVQEGTNIGNALPNITQYVVLKEEKKDLESKQSIIFSLLNNAFKFVKKIKNERSMQNTSNLILTSLATFGVIKLCEIIFKENK